MSGIDSRILVVGLPQITASIRADAEQAVWFTQGYVLASTIMSLLIGRITDIYGRVRFYKVGFIIFTICSLLVSLSQNPTEMIAFRLVQGVGTSMIWTNSVAMITDATPRNELGLSLGINQLASRLGSLLGLTVSGVILLVADWRALFYINIPIGIFGIVWAHIRLKEIATVEKGAPIDWLGFVTFMTFITSILLSITYATYGASQFDLARILLLLSGVSGIFFVLHERRISAPLLDLKLLRVKEFSISTLDALINVATTSGILILLSLYLQLVVGYSPFEAGIRILPVDIALVSVAPFSGRFSDSLRKPLAFMLVGILVTSSAMLLLSTLQEATPYPTVASYMVMLGAGLGLFLSPNASWGMSSVPANRRGVASALRGVFWEVGLAMSFNMAVWMMTFAAPYSVVNSVISAGSSAAVSESLRQPFLKGLDNAFFLLALLNFVSLIPTLFAAGLKLKVARPLSETNVTSFDRKELGDGL